MSHTLFIAMSILSMMQQASELCSESDIESQDDTTSDDELRDFVELILDEMQCDAQDQRAAAEAVESFLAHPYHGYYLRVHGCKTIAATLIFMGCAYLRKCSSLSDLTAVIHGQAAHTTRMPFCRELFRVTGADTHLACKALEELQTQGIAATQFKSTYTF